MWFMRIDAHLMRISKYKRMANPNEHSSPYSILGEWHFESWKEHISWKGKQTQGVCP